MDGARVWVDVPAAWITVPAAGTFFHDPDEDDNPARHSAPPDGGWEPIGRAVVAVFSAVQSTYGDPTLRELHIDLDARGLTPLADWTVSTWLKLPCAPIVHPEVAEVIDGRHRLWGLLSSGLPAAPAIHLMLGDAIRALSPTDVDEPITVDAEFVDEQRAALEWWASAVDAVPWRAANPTFEARWETIVTALERNVGAPR
jgi:hypothetical protein